MLILSLRQLVCKLCKIVIRNVCYLQHETSPKSGIYHGTACTLMCPFCCNKVCVLISHWSKTFQLILLEWDAFIFFFPAPLVKKLRNHKKYLAVRILNIWCITRSVVSTSLYTCISIIVLSHCIYLLMYYHSILFMVSQIRYSFIHSIM